MFTNDYIMRQIEMLSRSVRYIFGLEEESNDFYNNIVAEASDISTLKSILYKLVSENKFCEAEDYLFIYLDEHPDEDILMTAINFYSQLNKKNDDELLAYNFPREEIMDGLRSVEKIIAKNTGNIKKAT